MAAIATQIAANNYSRTAANASTPEAAATIKNRSRQSKVHPFHAPELAQTRN